MDLRNESEPLKFRLQNLVRRLKKLLVSDDYWFESEEVEPFFKAFYEIRAELLNIDSLLFADLPQRRMKEVFEELWDAPRTPRRQIEALLEDYNEAMQLLGLFVRSTSGSAPELSIPENVRRDIFEDLIAANVACSGRLSDREFLSRSFDLSLIPANSPSFLNVGDELASGYAQNSLGWIYLDARFNLLSCSDDSFLSFLCEMVHPVVRQSSEEAQLILEIVNHHLLSVGWELYEKAKLGRAPLFAARKSSFSEVNANSLDLSSQHNALRKQLEFIIQESPDVAVANAIDYLTSVCSSILTTLGIAGVGGISLQSIVEETLLALKLRTPDELEDEDASNFALSLRIIPTALLNIVQKGDLMPRHARLAANVSIALAEYLSDTLVDKIEKLT